MRTIILALLLLPAGLAAQTRPAVRHVPMPALQTATFDVAAAFQQHYRAAIEPLVFGRFAIGIAGEYTTHPDQPPGGIFYPVDDCPINRLCTAGGNDDTGYTAWSFNVHARWYPALLSFGGPRQSVGVYLGEFLGFHERRLRQPVYYGCPNCYYPPPSPDTIPPPVYPLPGPPAYTQTLHGWEPGVEVGIRLIPMRHIVMDIGGRFRLATIQDYRSGPQPGGVDARLVVAVGVGW